MKRWVDTRSHCGHCRRHFADHTHMTGACRHTVWDRGTATHVCDCREFEWAPVQEGIGDDHGDEEEVGSDRA